MGLPFFSSPSLSYRQHFIDSEMKKVEIKSRERTKKKKIKKGNICWGTICHLIFVQNRQRKTHFLNMNKEVKNAFFTGSIVLFRYEHKLSRDILMADLYPFHQKVGSKHPSPQQQDLNNLLAHSPVTKVILLPRKLSNFQTKIFVPTSKS